MIALQLLAMFENIFKSLDLDMFLYPYHVVATGDNAGVIECVPNNATSRHRIGEMMKKIVSDERQTTLYHYFLYKFGNEDSPSFQVTALHHNG